MTIVKLASEFFKALLEEAQKDERVVGDDATVILRTILTTLERKKIAWTMRVQGGRLESVSETIEDGASGLGEDADSLNRIPTLHVDERTVNEIIAKTTTPLRAFMRGSIRVTGDKDAWRILAEPAKRAAARVVPLLDQQLQWPTFSQVEFVQRHSAKWTPDLPKCQVCGTAFGTFFFRPHHCRVCGRVVCGACSPHSLAGNRACESCFMQLAVNQNNNKLSTSTPQNGSARSSLPKIKYLPGSVASSLSSSSAAPSHEHEKGHGPTILSRALDAVKQNEIASPIECAKAESRTERLLRTTAITSLQETRALKKELNEIKSGKISIKSIIRHTILLGIFVLCWRASSSSSLAWYVLVGFSSYWKHSIAALALTQPVFAIAPLTSLSLVQSTSPISLGLALTVGLSQAVVHQMFQRLFRIYTTSFAIIVIYQSVKIVCDRVLRLPEKAKAPIFDRVDQVVAPMACDEVLALKSVFVKFGQYLGARSDVVPVTWSAVLAKLQDDMPFDDVSHVSSLLKTEGFDLESDDFDEFDLVPVASASIAQVHKAKYMGSRVAVKVQHHRVEEMMRDDMKAFKRIMRFIVWLNPRFDLAMQLLNAWEVEMLKELDFTTEASNLTRVKKACSSLKDVIVPELVKATKRVLIMKWVDGFKITDVNLLDLYGVDREALLKRCVQAYSHQIFLDGFFQADPHAGNLMLQPPSLSSSSPEAEDEDSHYAIGRLVLLDFGMCVTLPEKTRLAYCKLLVALAHLSVSELAQAITLAGYENSQSQISPERDLEFFLFLLRDTGTREEARKESKEFMKMRKEQRASDEAKLSTSKDAKTTTTTSKNDSEEKKEEDEVPTEGRYFKQMPDSLLFLMRTLGLLRGLCTTLGTPTSYLENMVDYAKLALILNSLSRLDEQVEEKRRLKKIKRLAGTDLERKVAKFVLDEAERLEGGYQIFVMQDSRVLVDLCGGTLSDCDAKQVLPETLFPLCDLSKVLCSLAALYAVAEKKIELDQPLLGPQSVGATLRETLCHAATGMQDAVSPSSFGHQLRQNYDRVLLRVGKEAAQTSLKTTKSEFHTQSFGYEIDLALRNSLAATDLVSQVRDKVLTASSKSKPNAEVIFGGMEESLAEDDYAKASHGYAETVRLAMASSAGASFKSPAGSGNKLPSLSSLGPLPGRVVPDAAMVNDSLTMKSNLPSFGAFGTARGLALAVDDAIRRIPLKFWNEKVAKVEGTEENALVGKTEWGLGFVVNKSASTSTSSTTNNNNNSVTMLSHHSFGGSHLLFVPEKKLVMVVLVSHLTIERELTKNVLRIICQEFGLPLPSLA